MVAEIPDRLCRDRAVIPHVANSALVCRLAGNVSSYGNVWWAVQDITGHWVLTIPIAEATSLNRLDGRPVYLISGPSCWGGRSGKS
jgi:hypothetical protein